MSSSSHTKPASTQQAGQQTSPLQLNEIEKSSVLNVHFAEDHSIEFKQEEISGVSAHDLEKIKTLVNRHYKNFTRLRHVRNTVLSYPSASFKKYDIVVSYSDALFDHDVVEILSEHVEQLKDENREGMAKCLSKYIEDRRSLMEKYKGNNVYVRMYEDRDYEVILEGNGIIPHVSGTAVYKVGDELGLADAFYVNRPTGQYYELQVIGGGIDQNKLLVSVTLIGPGNTVFEVENALVDTGATTSVFSYQALRSLHLRESATPCELGGVGTVHGMMLNSITAKFFDCEVVIRCPRFLDDDFWRGKEMTALIGMDLIQTVMWKIEGGDVSVWSDYPNVSSV
jgi:predicted aspartyl protease